MSIAATVQTCLSQQAFIRHHREPRTSNSTDTAEAAHVPGAKLAKSVVLEDGDKYPMAVVPATHSVDIGALYQRLGREIGLASEEQIAQIFADCEPGAVPPLGQVYGIETILDEAFVDAEMCTSRAEIIARSCTSTERFSEAHADTPRARIGIHH